MKTYISYEVRYVYDSGGGINNLCHKSTKFNDIRDAELFLDEIKSEKAKKYIHSVDGLYKISTKKVK